MADQKRKVGRPSKGVRKNMLLKVSPTAHAKIKAYAKSHNLIINELMVQATLKMIEGDLPQKTN